MHPNANSLQIRVRAISARSLTALNLVLDRARAEVSIDVVLFIICILDASCTRHGLLATLALTAAAAGTAAVAAIAASQTLVEAREKGYVEIGGLFVDGHAGPEGGEREQQSGHG